MDFLYKTIMTVLIGCILFTIPVEIYLWILLITGFISWEFILMILLGKIEFKFKSNKKNPLEEVPIKFNDIDNTEIYITDIMGYRYALLLGKGYVVTDECIRDLYIKYTE